MTTNERDELAKVIESGYGDDPTDCPYDHAPTIADVILAEYILVRRSDLPPTHLSEYGNGVCTALAQEFYQPQLRYSPEDGDMPGGWNRKIAYANLAVALAVEAPEATS